MDTQPFTVRLPLDLYEMLRRKAFETRASQASIVVAAVGEYLAYEGPHAPQVPSAERSTALCLVNAISGHFRWK